MEQQVIQSADMNSLRQSDKLALFADRAKLGSMRVQEESTKRFSAEQSKSGPMFTWESFDFTEASQAGGFAETSRLMGEGMLEASTKYLPKKAKAMNMSKLRMVARTIAAFHPHLTEVQRHIKQAKEMRCLALISHNNMKGAMKEFVIRHQSVLKRFRLTGTNSTMTMLKSVLGTDEVCYGPTCSSGPLGGDAEVGALMCVEDLGGMFFFTDPLDPHPHAADITALIRMADLNNVIHASNPSTGDALVRVLKEGLDDPLKIPTFFTTVMSPAIEWHKTHWGGAMFTPPQYIPAGPLACLFEGPLACFAPK